MEKVPFYRKYAGIIFILFNVMVFESVCFGAYKFILKDYFFVKQVGYYQYDDYFDTVVEAKRGSTAEWYNQVLGWVPVAESKSPNKNCLNESYEISYGKDSQRVNPYGEKERAIISTYGDSFTEGEEVNDNQTFQFYLSQLTQSNVRNFGVGAYGTDQALLRLENNLRNGIDHPEIVVLSVYTENSKRILGSYRPFLYRQKEAQLTFKPRFFNSETGGELQLIENPLSTPFTEENLREAYAEAKKYDYWYQVNDKRPVIRFPYLVTMPWAFVQKYLEYQDNLWDGESGIVMDHILKRFIALSNEYQFTPVISFLPTIRDVKNHLKGKPPQYQRYVKKMRESASFENAIVIDMLEEQFDVSKFFLGGLEKSCHCSPYGNQVIAKTLYSHIEQGQKVTSVEQ